MIEKKTKDDSFVFFAEIFYKKIWANAKESGKDKILKIVNEISI